MTKYRIIPRVCVYDYDRDIQKTHVHFTLEEFKIGNSYTYTKWFKTYSAKNEDYWNVLGRFDSIEEVTKALNHLKTPIVEILM